MEDLATSGIQNGEPEDIISIQELEARPPARQHQYCMLLVQDTIMQGLVNMKYSSQVTTLCAFGYLTSPN